MAKPLLFILTGPSGVGKATVAKKVFECTERIAKVVTYASRPMRPGEQNHVTYHFVSGEEFKRKIEAGELFEWEKVYGDAYYGSPRDPFENVPEGFDALLEIGAGGMKAYRAAFPEALTIFLAPPSMEAILDRIEKRGGGEGNLENRLSSAVAMLKEAEEYRYIVVNDRLDSAAEQLRAIILAARANARHGDVLDNLQRQVTAWKATRAGNN